MRHLVSIALLPASIYFHTSFILSTSSCSSVSLLFVIAFFQMLLPYLHIQSTLRPLFSWFVVFKFICPRIVCLSVLFYSIIASLFNLMVSRFGILVSCYVYIIHHRTRDVLGVVGLGIIGFTKIYPSYTFYYVN